jgi:anthranilate synthase component 2
VILVIDNYDSFTWNLVQYLGELGGTLKVVRNDELDVPAIAALEPERIVISPGPGTPDQAGVSIEVIRRLGPTTPMLGVCLGHQAIGQAFGATVARAQRQMHGKTSTISHDGRGVFRGLPDRFVATRYHSLAILPGTVPEALEVSAWAEDGEIMGVRHRQYPVEGVQFHPESILTLEGKRLLGNFLT